MNINQVRQLHSDLKELAHSNPLHHAQPGMYQAFNSKLDNAKGEYPNDVDIASLQHANHSTRLSDLYIMAGQLMSALECHQPIVVTYA